MIETTLKCNLLNIYMIILLSNRTHTAIKMVFIKEETEDIRIVEVFSEEQTG